MATSTEQAPSHLETIDYNPAATASGSNMHSDEKKTGEPHDDDHDDDDHDLYHHEEEWDEGGKSHCGYSETVHATLMTVGQSVHKLVGEPSPRIEAELKAVGNWFQEASYAARDLFVGTKHCDEHGDSGMGEDALDAVKTLLGGSPSKNREEEKNDGNSYVAPTTQEPVTATHTGTSV